MNDKNLLLKSKPITLNTEMVRVILSDLKNETRRIIRPQSPYDDSSIFNLEDGIRYNLTLRNCVCAKYERKAH